MGIFAKLLSLNSHADEEHALQFHSSSPFFWVLGWGGGGGKLLMLHGQTSFRLKSLKLQHEDTKIIR